MQISAARRQLAGRGLPWLGAEREAWQRRHAQKQIRFLKKELENFKNTVVGVRCVKEAFDPRQDADFTYGASSPRGSVDVKAEKLRRELHTSGLAWRSPQSIAPRPTWCTARWYAGRTTCAMASARTFLRLKKRRRRHRKQASRGRAGSGGKTRATLPSTTRRT